jgi:hypothetical protein
MLQANSNVPLVIWIYFSSCINTCPSGKESVAELIAYQITYSMVCSSSLSTANVLFKNGTCLLHNLIFLDKRQFD